MLILRNPCNISRKIGASNGKWLIKIDIVSSGLVRVSFLEARYFGRFRLKPVEVRVTLYHVKYIIAVIIIIIISDLNRSAVNALPLLTVTGHLEQNVQCVKS